VDSLANIFVYGTLKKGQCREQCWPLSPLSTRAAWTFGQLYDLGEYPAMLPGNERVAGQVWSYHKSDLQRVLGVLDRIEGTNQPGCVNEYDRVEILVTVRGSDTAFPALAYVYARPSLLERYARRMSRSLDLQEGSYLIWPADSGWED
jgi:gamma-glutamylcyclotransferase (GGCT)/AIG2-like uncharacterized protein YtfP